jgi:hypothetical protein
MVAKAHMAQYFHPGWGVITAQPYTLLIKIEGPELF